jgi:hypothetical protein
LDHGSKFICGNQELKDIDKQIVSKQKKIVGISYHKCTRGSTHQQEEEESKNNGGKIESVIKKNLKKRQIRRLLLIWNLI